jgi:hypothetical protein
MFSISLRKSKAWAVKDFSYDYWQHFLWRLWQCATWREQIAVLFDFVLICDAHLGTRGYGLWVEWDAITLVCPAPQDQVKWSTNIPPAGPGIHCQQMSGYVLWKPCRDAVIPSNIKPTYSTLLVSNIFSLDSAHNFFQQLLLLPGAFTTPHVLVTLTVFPLHGAFLM